MNTLFMSNQSIDNLTEEIKDLKKKTAPLVTPSGSFSERKVDSLRKHSGFIAIDIDNIDDPAATKKRISADAFLYSAFISIGPKSTTFSVVT